MSPSDSRDGSIAQVAQEIILSHYRRPRNRGALPDADLTVEKTIPSCGDEISLSLRLDNDRIIAAAFNGQGCSVCLSSASMMTELLIDRTIDEVRTTLARFSAMLTGDKDAAADVSLGDARALAGVSKYPTRIRCAMLGWRALEEAISTKSDEGVSERLP
jgi:nitrogen fixation protein NifU and related proteins